MTVVSPPLSPHIGVDGVPPQKKRMSLSGFSTSTPFSSVSQNDNASTSSSFSDDNVSAVHCLPCGAGQVLPLQLTQKQQPLLYKRRGGRVVSFSLLSNQEFESLRHSDYTAKEFRATWYSHQELNDMKKERHTLIQRMDLATSNGINWDHLEETCTDLCVRGLESKTKSGRRQRHAEIAAVTAAVLDEQDVQYARGVLEANVIAYLCEMHTRQSMMRARRQGMKDAAVAQWMR